MNTTVRSGKRKNGDPKKDRENEKIKLKLKLLQEQLSLLNKSIYNHEDGEEESYEESGSSCYDKQSNENSVSYESQSESSSSRKDSSRN